MNLTREHLLLATLVLAIPGWGLAGNNVVVTPKGVAAYMYLKADNAAVTTQPVYPAVSAELMTAAKAGTCATQTTIGGACVWSDGKSFRYAGALGTGRKVFAEAIGADPYQTWGCYGIRLYVTSTTDGLANTNVILRENYLRSPCMQSGTTHVPYAAVYCYDKQMYLPASSELALLYNARASLGGFSAGNYWTSTEADDYTASILTFSGGSTNTNSKFNPAFVRCVRSF